jgi:hypothetical protein
MFDKQAMLEAHVQFELARWQGASLRSTLAEEVAALFAWAESIRLNEVATPAQIIDVIQRVVINMPVADELVASIRESVQVVFEQLQEEATPIEMILPRALFDRITASVIGMEGLRHEVTRQVVTSAVYTQLISNVLYHGIKGYLLSENTITRKIPGASSLMKLGQSALSSTAPQLEKAIDRQLIAFIRDNLQETIRESERFLNGALDEATLCAVADEIWAANAQTPLSTLAGYTDAATVDGAVEIALAFWRHFRSTPLFLALVEQVVRNFFLRKGKKNVSALLAEVGVTPAVVTNEVYALAAPGMEAARQSGYLEGRIRARLAVFYATYNGMN